MTRTEAIAAINRSKRPVYGWLAFNSGNVRVPVKLVKSDLVAMMIENYEEDEDVDMVAVTGSATWIG